VRAAAGIFIRRPNSGGGTLQINSSTLQGNPSGEFQNAPGIFDKR